MSQHPLVTSCYAAARKHLRDARTAQKNALVFGLDVYRAGPRAKKARALRKQWDRRRADALAEVLRIRTKIQALRAAVRAIEEHCNDSAAAE